MEQLDLFEQEQKAWQETLEYLLSQKGWALRNGYPKMAESLEVAMDHAAKYCGFKL